MITRSDIELICNYSETITQGQPTIEVYYTEFKKSDEAKREIIREKRDRMLDAILYNKVEEFEEFGKKVVDDFKISRIYTRLMRKSLNAKKFISYDDLWYEVTKRLEYLTTIKQKSNTVSKSGLNYINIFRKILSKCLMLSNMIYKNSYSGPATSIIIGEDIKPYITALSYMSSPSNTSNRNILGELGGLNVIVSNNISPNKIIVIRTESRITTGLSVIKVSNHDQYFIDELGNWKDKIEWFEVI